MGMQHQSEMDEAEDKGKCVSYAPEARIPLEFS